MRSLTVRKKQYVLNRAPYKAHLCAVQVSMAIVYRRSPMTIISAMLDTSAAVAAGAAAER